MKRWFAAFSLIAMTPAVINAAPALGTVITMRMCNSAGETVEVSVPGQPQLPRRTGDEGCCVKGCHGGSSRKRFVRDN